MAVVGRGHRSAEVPGGRPTGSPPVAQNVPYGLVPKKERPTVPQDRPTDKDERVAMVSHRTSKWLIRIDEMLEGLAERLGLVG